MKSPDTSVANEVTGHFAYSLNRSPTRFHVIHTLIQLYMYSKNSTITIDMADIAITIDMAGIAGRLFLR